MRGRGRWWTAVAGATAAVLLGAGCGAGTGSGEGASAPSFGRETAHTEIVAAVEKAGLPKSDLPGIGGPTPTGSTPRPTPSTERERLEERALACTAAWQYAGPPVDGSRGDLEKAVTALVGKGWVQGERQVEKLDEHGGTMLQITLRKRGWVMYARHTGVQQSLTMEMISLHATETACMNRFTEQERKALFGDAEQG
ncbi:hypothetical protein GCM10010222_26350 [Streptomyces tanashiensis]|uniref:hypothetical protein n=1 Tax=Streptomyces tanashiensis TaxID=67367 RepID=UPI0016778BEE|nr:hypothetical protein [Streptomyces tanashiensis]GGS83583.1 hypothetical protein GCM10010222_26350 [Streptomyces tanashiensis]